MVESNRSQRPRGWRLSSVACGVAAACVVSLSVGCGGPATAELAGKVTIGGKPIPDDAVASIRFTPPSTSKAEPVSAPIQGGTYAASGVPVGPVSVSFSISRPVGPVKHSERTGQDYQEQQNLVPPGKATGVELTIDGDNPNQDFDL